jgi:hypothetical protein
MDSLLVAYDLVGTDDTSDDYEKLIARIKAALREHRRAQRLARTA